MNIRVKSTSTIKRTPLLDQEHQRLHFVASRPTIVQPSEIMKVQTDLLLKISNGFILTITTHPDLAVKATELFPGVITLDSASTHNKVLEIPIRNSGRNQLNIMQGQPIALGYLTKLETIEIKDLEIDLSDEEKGISTPQKKNTGVKFELK